MRTWTKLLPVFGLLLPVCAAAAETSKTVPVADPYTYTAVFPETPAVQHDPEVLAGPEFLPLDKFDEYLTGYEPPHPWRAAGQAAEGTSILLQGWAESPVTGNNVNGKGVVISDLSTTGGDGYGFTTDFLPPALGPLQLSVDFCSEFAPGKDTPALMIDLGKQVRVRVRAGGEVETLDAAGKATAIGTCAKNKWYHLSVLMVSGSDRARFSLTEHPGKKSGNGSIGKIAPFVELPLAAPVRYPSSLSFTLAGSPRGQGAWRVDNVCMAGNIDAPRARWWPFKPLPREEMDKLPKKVFTYNFPPFGAGQNGEEDPGTNWNFTAEWLSPVRPHMEADRMGAGCKALNIALPRPQLPELEKWQSLALEMFTDVRLAKQQGNDGFIMDFNQNPAGGWGYLFNRKTFYTMDAAAREGGFKILPAVYSSSGGSGYGEADKGCDPAQYARHDIYKKALVHPATLRTPEGKVVISQWGAERHTPQWWKQVLATLEQDGTPAVFLGQFNNYHGIEQFKDVAWGMSDWGPREPNSNYTWAQRARPFTKIVGVPIVMQDVRSRGCDVFESQNSATLRKLWMTAINDNADWAVINTWNDFSEQALMPATATGFTAFDINAYYIQWFKTGQQPPIIRDVLYYFYRRHHTDAPQNHGAKWDFRNPWLGGAKNEIELLAFLREPGTLLINVDGEVFRQAAPAGITSFKVPLPRGKRFVPYFALERGGAEILGGKGRYTVFERVEFPNLLYHSGVVVR